MASKKDKPRTAGLLDAVAVLSDVPDRSIVQGQVGTVVELLDDDTVLVEFSDDNGKARSIEPLAIANLLVLRYVSAAA
ncbi:MAG: DUF4926 domain-containing protein [Parvibaculaceae bacterium]